MHVEFLALFLIGFLGGFSHCIGMCGGIVLTYTIKIRENDPVNEPSKWQLIKPHLLYNSGRIITYSILGEIFGFIGGTIGVILAIHDFQGVLQLLTGIIMLLIGIELAGLIHRILFPVLIYLNDRSLHFLIGLTEKTSLVLG